jgi:hypothetical protein
MKNLLNKYLLNGITFEGEGGAGGGAPAAAAPEVVPAAAAPAVAAPVEPASPSAAPITGLAKAAAAAAAGTAPVTEPVKTDPAAAFVDDPAKTPEENAAAKAEHEAAQAKAAEDKGKEGGEEVDPASYKIEIPEGFELDPAVDKQFREFAAKNKFTQDQVASLKDMQVAMYAKQTEALAKQVTEWGNEVNADKEFGGPNVDANMAIAGVAINEFFSPKVAALLDKTGLGNHPEFVRGFYRIGLTMSELPTFNAKTGGSGKLDAVSVLYGDK